MCINDPLNRDRLGCAVAIDLLVASKVQLRDRFLKCENQEVREIPAAEFFAKDVSQLSLEEVIAIAFGGIIGAVLCFGITSSWFRKNRKRPKAIKLEDIQLRPRRPTSNCFPYSTSSMCRSS